jgi:hypothetical protein
MVVSFRNLPETRASSLIIPGPNVSALDFSTYKT